MCEQSKTKLHQTASIRQKSVRNSLKCMKYIQKTAQNSAKRCARDGKQGLSIKTGKATACKVLNDRLRNAGLLSANQTWLTNQLLSDFLFRAEEGTLCYNITHKLSNFPCNT